MSKANTRPGGQATLAELAEFVLRFALGALVASAVGGKLSQVAYPRWHAAQLKNGAEVFMRRVQPSAFTLVELLVVIAIIGIFSPNSYLRIGECTDGTSHTLFAAEVKAWTPYTERGRQ